MANQSQIIQQLQSNAALVAMSDADAATQLSVPILTPVSAPVTWTTVGSALGLAAAIIVSASFAAAASNPALNYINTLLSGAGFNAADPNVQAGMQEVIAAGLLTQAQANAILFVTTYLCGGIVVTADVTAARAATVLQAAATLLYQKISAGNLAAIAAVDAGVASGTLPTSAQLIAAFTGSIS